MQSIKTLKTCLIGDSEIIITAELLEVKGNFATILYDGKDLINITSKEYLIEEK